MKALSVLSILIVAFLGFYYFTFFAPQQRELSMRIKCRELGEKFGKESELVNESGRNVEGREYIYSKKLNTCVYAWSSSFDRSEVVNGRYAYKSTSYTRIADVLTGQILIEKSDYTEKDIKEKVNDDLIFLNKKKEIFNNKLSESEQWLLNELQARK